MTTLAQVIDRTRRRLLTSRRPGMNVLAAPITDGVVTTFTVTEGDRITEGNRISVELEDMHVISGTSGTTVNVIRGIDSSVAVAHASGAIVRTNPPWTDYEIAAAINDELADLSGAGLFRIKSLDFDFNPSTYGYDIPATDLLSVWRVRYNTPGPHNVWPVVPNNCWRLDEAADTTDFPSGFQLVLAYGQGYPGQKIRVSYRASFDPLATLADDVLAVSGLHTEAHDILSLGAGIRLMAGLEVQNAISTAQDNPRRANELPPRSGSAAIVPLVQQRDERIRSERRRLLDRYPVTI
jgi:hypothetical protein